MTVVDDISCLHAKVASSAEPTLWARVDDLHRGTRAGWATSGSAAPGMALPKGARAAAEAEAQRLATFLDGELELSWATP